MDHFFYQRNLIKQFLKSATAVSPAKLISENLKIENGNLVISGKFYKTENKDIYLIGFGKAAFGMARECEKILGKYLKFGVICGPEDAPVKSAHISSEFKSSVLQFHKGAKNNLPDENSEKATNEIISLVELLDEAKDHLIVLISGGGSALFVKPKPGISLAEKIKTVNLLMKSGANIKELNCVRKKLSAVKGGGLACISYPVPTTCLIISDVINDPLEFIASGPTFPPSDSDINAYSVLKKYNLENEVPSKILAELKENSLNPINSIDNSKFLHVDNFIIGNNRRALEASKNFGEESGFKSLILSSQVSGNVHDVSSFYVNMIYEILMALNERVIIEEKNVFKNFYFNVEQNFLSELNNIIQTVKFDHKVCIIAGGETTVNVRGKGMGGRNQELALLTSVKVYDLKMKHSHLFEKFEVTFLFAGTDGIDGPTDAAGAIGGPFIVEKAERHKLNINTYLSENNSYNFFKTIDGGAFLIKTGPTGTNVMDIHTFIIYNKSILVKPTSNNKCDFEYTENT